MKKIFWIIPAVLLVFAILAFRPLPVPTEENCVSVNGEIENIFERGNNDIALTLKGHAGTFYVNRGIEKGLTPEKLKNDLKGQPVEVKFPKYWTPLDPFNKNRHIAEITVEGEVLFSEIQ